MKNKTKPFYEFYKLQKELNSSLIDACYDGDLNKVKYLLTSPDLKHQLSYSHADSYISEYKVKFVKKIFEIKGLHNSLEKEINYDKVSNKTIKFKI